MRFSENLKHDSYASDVTSAAADCDNSSASFFPHRDDHHNRSQSLDQHSVTAGSGAAPVSPDDVGLSLDDDLQHAQAYMHVPPPRQVATSPSDLFLIQSTTNLCISDSELIHQLKRSRSNETFATTELDLSSSTDIPSSAYSLAVAQDARST
jgi:hypothetical protein